MTLHSTPTGVTETPVRRRRLSVTATNLLDDRDIRGLPCWVRAPVRGVEFYSGVSRAKLYDLSAKGLIRSASLREPGQIKGTRLFDLQSVLSYIAKNEVEPICSSKDATVDDQQAAEKNPTDCK